ncbi:hypothetical protein LQ948_16875 [Jiella sp. MQZ9-1]|uniref:Uncharacterized protein n=1 Tax=Jiella flava TaxID=2816857 RepID=A0A939FYA3_9HYPH|nr:hypothetical protein [Jiella flava]MBO0664238.1 hypothetical protein [Jiella flava]MCD2472884.1 hypothetical protein [Jiella flava]
MAASWPAIDRSAKIYVCDLFDFQPRSECDSCWNDLDVSPHPRTNGLECWRRVSINQILAVATKAMMQICYKLLVMDPQEAVVGIMMIGGPEEVIIDQSILQADSTEVGEAIATRSGQKLVELPRESVRGRMRVWICALAVQERDAALLKREA